MIPTVRFFCVNLKKINFDHASLFQDSKEFIDWRVNQAVKAKYPALSFLENLEKAPVEEKPATGIARALLKKLGVPLPMGLGQPNAKPNMDSAGSNSKANSYFNLEYKI